MPHSTSQSQTLDKKAQGPGISSSASRTMLPASKHLPITQPPGVRPDSGQPQPQTHPGRSASRKSTQRPPQWQLGLTGAPSRGQSSGPTNSHTKIGILSSSLLSHMHFLSFFWTWELWLLNLRPLWLQKGEENVFICPLGEMSHLLPHNHPSQYLDSGSSGPCIHGGFPGLQTMKGRVRATNTIIRLFFTAPMLGHRFLPAPPTRRVQRCPHSWLSPLSKGSEAVKIKGTRSYWK